MKLHETLSPLPLLVVLVSLTSLIPVATPAWAGEGLFSRVYTSETVPAKHWELEQAVRNRSGRSFGHYSAFDFKTEFEYGITDNFQGALYINTGHISADGAPDDDDVNGATGFTRHNTFLQSISLEFVYRVWSPVMDPIGIAFYFEPSYDFHDLHNGLKYDKTLETEYRLLLQKNFFDDQLIVAYNAVAEIEFVRFDGQETWRGELDFNNEIGASYRFAANWYAGLELRNHNELGDFKHHEHSVFWAGPAIHYGAANFWATLGLLAQFSGNPNGTDDNGTFIGSHLFLRSHERYETTAKFSFPF